MNYANQLELMGYWEWAIYVVLNLRPNENTTQALLATILPGLSGDNARNTQRVSSSLQSNIGSPFLPEKTIKEIISRNIPNLIEHPEKKSFLTEVYILLSNI
jgi:hypothetical protein